jgi:hypothetical protein
MIFHSFPNDVILTEKSIAFVTERCGTSFVDSSSASGRLDCVVVNGGA